MLLIDTKEGRIIDDEEIKESIAGEHPYREWLDQYQPALDRFPKAEFVPVLDHETILLHEMAFGYTHEELRMILGPMAQDGIEPVGSMGMDMPLAVLSEKPQLLYNYFKQLFAQVTNPPIDSIREEIVTDMSTNLGPERNLLHPEPESCRQISLHSPILTNEDLAKLAQINRPGFKVVTLPILFDPAQGGAGLEQAMQDLCRAAETAIAEWRHDPHPF